MDGRIPSALGRFEQGSGTGRPTEKRFAEVRTSGGPIFGCWKITVDPFDWASKRDDALNSYQTGINRCLRHGTTVQSCLGERVRSV